MPSKITLSCKHDDLEQFCLAVSVDNINTPDCWGRYPLYYAIRYGAIENIRHAIKIGGDLLLCNRLLQTDIDCLTVAIKYNTIIISELFHNVKNRIDPTKYLPLILAVRNRQTSDPNKENIIIFDQYIKIFDIISFGGLEGVFCRYARNSHYEYCKKYSICYDLQETLKFTLLYRKYGCFIYNLQYVQYGEQLDHIYKLSATKTTSLLSICAIQGYYKGITSLISHGANPYILTVGDNGETYNALMATANNQRYFEETPYRQQLIIKCICQLCKAGISINFQNSLGITALMMACRIANADIVSHLIMLGSDITLMDINGNTAINYLTGARSSYGNMNIDSNINIISGMLNV